jgi:TolB-like protein/Tfp pilus assembly protein PilF
MAQNPRALIRIDLNQFKLHISLKEELEVSLHFNSPSRQFYLSVIALVVHEMKKRGHITSIPLEEHLDLLALLNETVGGSAGSSEKEHLLPRIYRKWKDALPDLEDAPLFKVLGRKRDYDDGVGRTYPFTQAEKDTWANLFEYRGSEEYVRVRFSVDKLGVSLDDVAIVFGEDPELVDAGAWEAFIASLKQEAEERPERRDRISAYPGTRVSPLVRWTRGLPRRWRWPTLAITIGLVVAIAAVLVWKSSFYPPQAEVATLENMAFPLPDKPSIAVLPFENMSGEPEHEYLCDGITEHIITCLSKTPKLFVIARHSTFTYKGKPEKVQEVSRELGVRYVMEGSIHRSGDRIRITAQLIDAITGHHLWAERYDRDLKDVFALQDEITMEILRAIEVKLTEGEQARIYRRGTDNIEAYVKALKAVEYFERFNKDDNAAARQLCEEAIDLDPKYARPYRVLSYTHMMDPFYGTSTSPQKSFKHALELARKAISLDDSHPCGYELLSYIYLHKRQHEQAIAEAERAIGLDPNGADSHVALGYALHIAGRPEEAIAPIRKAIRINPIAPGHYFTKLGHAYRMAGRYEEAIAAYRKALERSPDDIIAHYGLTATYSLSGRDDEARAQAKEVLRVQPKFSVERYAKRLPYKDRSEIERLMQALCKAGLE